MTVGIVIAMEREIKSFLDKVEAKQISTTPFDVWHFVSGGKQVYVCISSVGEICAAAATQLLISLYKVECIFNFGVVGALRESVALLSTMFVADTVHYDMDTTAFDVTSKVGQYSFSDTVEFRCDENLLKKAQALLPLPVARCASGDKFVEGKTAKADLSQKFDADICDMESAGIAIVCARNNVPWLMVKAVSDSLCGGGKEFGEQCEIAASAYMDFVTKLLGAL